MEVPFVKNVHMIILMQPVFEDSVEFYKKLGFNQKFHLKDKWAEMDLAGVLIGLCPTDKELPDRHCGVVFRVDDIEKVYNALKDSITFLNEPVEAPHGIMASVKDPGGNIFDLYQPTPEKLKEFVHQNTSQKEECESDCCGCEDHT